MQRSEGYFSGYDGADLYYQSWQQEDAKLNILLTHGLAEHSEAYDRLANGLADKVKVNIFAWDLRGHGKSPGKRGLVSSFDEFTEDLLCFYSYLKENTNDPIILLGHSMGGLISVKSLIDHANSFDVKACVLSSPFLGIQMEVPPLKHKAADFLAKYLPRLTMSNEIDFKSLSHDMDVVASYAKDPLRHTKISPKLYLEFLRVLPIVQERAKEFKLPLFLQFAGDDHLVSPSASLEFFDKVSSPEKKKIEYTNLYHEIYNEIEREKVYRDLSNFLESYIG